ncbi:hypothetical protein M413DRAFT_438882 [Hebeloma cylindrosporum]|uniref:Uncharacterized protein n=1 Tax=Hebeloma cylindrosporum TaxID=76867 RepID=A0A0C3CM22_HEBCY|nr:hypothetical protein M413DRAFT_438882 [Hebeloma cylindrosporum h7]
MATHPTFLALSCGGSNRPKRRCRFPLLTSVERSSYTINIKTFHEQSPRNPVSCMATVLRHSLLGTLSKFDSDSAPPRQKYLDAAASNSNRHKRMTRRAWVWDQGPFLSMASLWRSSSRR